MTERSQLQTKVAQLIIDCLELEGFVAETLSADMPLFEPEEAEGLGLDSLAALEIVATLSAEFDLSFEDVSREDMMTVGAIAAYVDRSKREGIGNAD